MNEYDIAEQAYKNGYAAGKSEVEKMIASLKAQIEEVRKENEYIRQNYVSMETIKTIHPDLFGAKVDKKNEKDS